MARGKLFPPGAAWTLSPKASGARDCVPQPPGNFKSHRLILKSKIKIFEARKNSKFKTPKPETGRLPWEEKCPPPVFMFSWFRSSVFVPLCGISAPGFRALDFCFIRMPATWCHRCARSTAVPSRIELAGPHDITNCPGTAAGETAGCGWDSRARALGMALGWGGGSPPLCGEESCGIEP